MRISIVAPGSRPKRGRIDWCRPLSAPPSTTLADQGQAIDICRPTRVEATALPGWIKPQLTTLVDKPPGGAEWFHEIKFDGYRMHARLDRGGVRLLTRTGLD
jgi:ATP-dependent DNA ligase